MALDLSTLELVPESRDRDETDEREEGVVSQEVAEIEADEFPFMLNVNRLIKLNGEVIGKIEANIFRRDEMQGHFHRLMNDTIEESSQHAPFALSLFDHNGRLREEFIAPQGRKSGKNVFGPELSKGAFAYINRIQITNHELRSQGAGTAALKLFKAFLSSSEVTDGSSSTPLDPVSFIFLWPLLLLDETDNEEYLIRAISFLRDNDFRRVGTSSYLACSLDPSHPSRSLPKDQDQRALQLPVETSDNPGRDYPLHFQISLITLPTDGTSSACSDPTLLTAIRNAPIFLIQLADARGQSPLHLAAAKKFLPAVQALVERSRKELLMETFESSRPLEMVRVARQLSTDFRRAYAAFLGITESEEERVRDEACEQWLRRETERESAK